MATESESMPLPNFSPQFRSRMNRRGFLSSMLALGVAPAVVSSGVLMPVKRLLLPAGELEIGVLDEVRFIETPGSVNFLLMQELLKQARKKLPYFNRELEIAHAADRLRFGGVHAIAG